MLKRDEKRVDLTLYMISDIGSSAAAKRGIMILKVFQKSLYTFKILFINISNLSGFYSCFFVSSGDLGSKNTAAKW